MTLNEPLGCLGFSSKILAFFWVSVQSLGFSRVLNVDIARV